MSRYLLGRVALFYSVIFIIFGTTSTLGSGYHYQIHKINEQVIHLVTIDPKQYSVHLIKAQGGRETVNAIAKRSNADIAINGGFFEMGAGREGIPTGSLVIKGKVYKVKNKTQALAIIDSDQFSIEFINAKKYLKTHLGTNTSFVSGIPLLINNGKIVEDILGKKSDFYTKPHARTAIGIRSNGEIVLCLAEHPYAKDLTKMTLSGIQAFLKKKSAMVSEQYRKKQGEFTVSDLKKIVKEEFSTPGVQGLTIVELAKFMKKLGCDFAMNLDGGGSSTLWIDGKVVNSTIGDEDEGKGISIVRPVSDAIIFNKK